MRAILRPDSDVVAALTATKQGSAAFKRLGFTPSDTDQGTGSRLLSEEAQMVERRGNPPFLDLPSSSH